MALPPEIAQSWRRTASAGLDPGSAVGTDDIGEYDPASALRRGAGPVLDALAEQLHESSYAVVLADVDTRIVDARFGRPALRARLEAAGAVDASPRRNLRELKALVAHLATVRAAGDVTVADLPPGCREQPGAAVSGALRQAERDTIVRALTRCSGNEAHAARELGIGRNTLYRRVPELRIDVDALRERP